MIIWEKKSVGNTYHKILAGICLFSIVIFLSIPCEAEREYNLIAPYNQYDLDLSSDDVFFYPQSHIEWSRLALLDLGYVLDENVSAGDDGPVLNLFDGVRFETVKKKLVRKPDGKYIWHGEIKGYDRSHVVIVINGDQAYANITLADEQWQIRPVMGEIHDVRKADQSGFADEMDPIPVGGLQQFDLMSQMDPVVAGDEDLGEIIDVLVVYTQTAASASADIESEILLAVEETNISYENSNINQRINLVHTAQVSYTDDSNLNIKTTLTQHLASDGDGYLDEVHDIRDQYKTDAVVLIVENGGGYCGMAYMMEVVSHFFEPYAFAVVARSCATGYYSFGHELGHNMGARHDCYVDTDPDHYLLPYPYAHGYVNTTDQWRTVMAYGNACGGCTRLPYWSNPDVEYNQDPMGTDSGVCQADNHQSLNNTAATVANFRSGGSSTRQGADFNGDGDTDILWRNSATNQVGIWKMNGANYLGWVPLSTVSADWKIVGTGDFNDDGETDIIWRHTDGSVGFWLMNGVAYSSFVSRNTASTDWKIVGSGDFNSDNKTDILWHNTVSGQVYIWFMNGTSINSTASVGYAPTVWTAVDAADFNNDNQTDILWRNFTTGQNLVWNMIGKKVVSATYLSSASTGWQIASTGDFNNDGDIDICWRNYSTGANGYWLMNGYVLDSWAPISSAAISWEIEHKE